MNHHLRFVKVPSCLSGGTLAVLAAALFSSCTQVAGPPQPTSKGPPPASIAPDAVAVTTHFYTVPDGFLPDSQPGQPFPMELLSREDGARQLRRLQRKRGASPADIPLVELKRKAGSKKSVQLTREHIYPTEYDPPVIGTKPGDGPDIFPVTPATPTSFETRDVGIQVTYGIHEISGSTIEFDCRFHRTSFVGDMNYGQPITTTATSFFGRPVEVVITENKILMAIFGTASSTTRVTMPSGSYLVLRGRKQPEADARTASFIRAPDQPPASSNSDWIALIQVSAGS